MSVSRRESGATVRLLTVGNSFSVNATRYLPELAKAAGSGVAIGPCSVGGASLQLHWEKAAAFERDPDAARANGGPYAGGRSLRNWLAAEDWDVVTIQQYSRISHDAATYQPFAGRLLDYIHRAAPRAEVVFLETWAYRCDTPDFSQTPPPDAHTLTREEMALRVKRAYQAAAKELGLRGIPVGDAFTLVEADPHWRFTPDPRFDPAAARPGERPDQTHSLHLGWFWQKNANGVERLAMDGRHASDAGQYLGACVLFEFLFGRNVVGNAFVPPTIDEPFAHRLRRAAHEAVVAAPVRAGR